MGCCPHTLNKLKSASESLCRKLEWESSRQFVASIYAVCMGSSSIATPTFRPDCEDSVRTACFFFPSRRPAYSEEQAYLNRRLKELQRRHIEFRRLLLGNQVPSATGPTFLTPSPAPLLIPGSEGHLPNIHVSKVMFSDLGPNIILPSLTDQVTSSENIVSHIACGLSSAFLVLASCY